MGLLTLLVHNDAIKTDPKEIYGWRVYALACSACFGGMLFGMETGIIGGVLTLDNFKEQVDPVAQVIRDGTAIANLEQRLWSRGLG
ncbi:uncharacterized protein LTR77_003679 [Saxophila tyrrhenica]|uniref:Uncharacterized protein n=1 Tax=Saxophila tyrrhenica TaxID=1690608 RepID=A0AAV9PFP9_9PEZI|nr:hypothetical protein LTR77_003679 [Saxophila tyrrhenica]